MCKCDTTIQCPKGCKICYGCKQPRKKYRSFRASDRGRCKWCANWERRQRAWRNQHGITEGYIPFHQWLDLMHRYKHRCVACGRHRMRLSVDHIVPLSRGGTHTLDNIQPMCLECNRYKLDRQVDFRTLAAEGIYIWSNRGYVSKDRWNRLRSLGVYHG